MIDSNERWRHFASIVIFVMTFRNKVKVNFNYPFLSKQSRYKIQTCWQQLEMMSLCMICSISNGLDKLGQGLAQPSESSIGHITVTIRDTDLWLITVLDHVTGHHLPYLWWPLKMSNQPLKFTINHTSVIIKDTHLWLTTVKDDVVL